MLLEEMDNFISNKIEEINANNTDNKMQFKGVKYIGNKIPKIPKKNKRNLSKDFINIMEHYHIPCQKKNAKNAFHGMETFLRDFINSRIFNELFEKRFGLRVTSTH
ncbi:MAG: hypothetical protein AAF310_05130 [Myxococcota bacterium]